MTRELFLIQAQYPFFIPNCRIKKKNDLQSMSLFLIPNYIVETTENKLFTRFVNTVNQRKELNI